ncbi:MAG: uncharacterized protein KVP18_004334 [Porospora cf. gigantea A]|uniref:uncharacterized protein n=2 Tax=Porospora cf. gigantea A TaxID=2853593 RepID=UPI003559E439|nr:MAG: hypothetical protein KVP18_004334 [Porospora cf. gigantea A]
MNSESDSTCTDSSGEPSPHSPLTWILSASVRDEKPRTTWLHSLAWQAQTLWKESKQWHHNVRTMLALRLAHGLTCHRNAALFDHVVLLRFEDDPVILGLIQALAGVVGVVAAVAVGYIGDRYWWMRSTLLRYVGVAGFAISGVTCLAILRLMSSEGSRCMGAYILCHLGWRGWHELMFTLTESTFVDSVEIGNRSRFFSYKTVINCIAAVAGPFAGLLFLGESTHSWRPTGLLRLLLATTAASMLENWLLLSWEEPQATRPKGGVQLGVTLPTVKLLDVPRRLMSTWRMSPSTMVPWVVFLSQCVHFAGAGITVKYLPLYFKNTLQFTPSQYFVLTAAYSLSISLTAFALRRVSLLRGRAEVAVVGALVAAGLMFSMSLVNSLWLAVPIHLLRGGIHNGLNPLHKSLIMDYSSQTERARWTAAGAVMGLCWSVSSVWGGVATEISVHSTFVVSSLFFAVAALILLPLTKLDTREHVIREKDCDS